MESGQGGAACTTVCMTGSAQKSVMGKVIHDTPQQSPECQQRQPPSLTGSLECLSWLRLLVQTFILFPRYNQASEHSIIALISSILHPVNRSLFLRPVLWLPSLLSLPLKQESVAKICKEMKEIKSAMEV
jgi:hypothetical protein